MSETINRALEAIKNGDISELIKLKESGWNPNKSLGSGTGNALHAAVSIDADVGIVDWLCEAGVDVNKSYDKQCVLPPLHLACYRGNKKAVRSLIAFNADVKSLWSGISPMVAAAIGGHMDIVKNIHSHEPSALHQLDVKQIPAGVKVFEYAVNKKDSDTMKWLEANGVDLSTHPLPLYYAIKQNYSPAIRKLIKLGANLDRAICTSVVMSQISNQNEILKRISDLGGDFNFNDGEPLLVAFCNGFDDTVIKQLLRNGADINHKDGVVVQKLAALGISKGLGRALEYGGNPAYLSVGDKGVMSDEVASVLAEHAKSNTLRLH